MDQNQNNQNKGPKNDDKKPKGNIWITLIITVIVILIGTAVFNFVKNSQYTQETLSHFLDAKENNQLAEVELRFDRIVYLTKEEAAKPAQEQKAYFTGLPSGSDTFALAQELREQGVKVNRQIVEDNSTLTMILMYVVMFALVFGGMTLLTKRMGGEGLMGSIGSSKAKMYMEKQTGVTFKDVAGQDEAKESLQEIIDFLHNPQKYAAIGAKLPKGALLVGSPGTGKTLLAKAVAGEADVPFFSISGSDFVEMFVGVGASRVRTCSIRRQRLLPALFSLMRSMR